MEVVHESRWLRRHSFAIVSIEGERSGLKSKCVLLNVIAQPCAYLALAFRAAKTLTLFARVK